MKCHKILENWNETPMWRMTIYCGFLILLQVERWRRPTTIEFFFIFFLASDDGWQWWSCWRHHVCVHCSKRANMSIVFFFFHYSSASASASFCSLKKISSSAQISDGVVVWKNWTQNFVQSSASKMCNAINAFIRCKALFWDTPSWEEIMRVNEGGRNVLEKSGCHCHHRPQREFNSIRSTIRNESGIFRFQ